MNPENFVKLGVVAQATISALRKLRRFKKFKATVRTCLQQTNKNHHPFYRKEASVTM